MSNKYIASRMKSLVPSASISIAEEVKEMKARGADIVDLSWGEPDFNTPQNIISAAKKGIDKGFTKYTNSRGIIDLRKAIIKKLKKENNLEYAPETEIIVTPGVKQGILYALLTFINPDDEVMVPEPCWLSYKDCISIAGGNFIPIPSTEENYFKITKENILKKITSKTKMIIINNPTNPTGTVWSKKDLEMIAEIAIEKDLLVVSDEIYEKIIFDNLEIISIASLPGMRERTIVLNGFSKFYAMTGWRVGYLAAPENFVSQLIKVHQHSATCASAISQYAAVEALEGPQKVPYQFVAEYQKRRDLIFEGFNNIDKLSCLKPRGTFYAFLNIKKIGMSSVKTAKYFLKKAKVTTIPGSAYGESGEGYLRICFATSQDNIKKTLIMLKRTLK